MDLTKSIELVQRAQDGDAVALDRLFERYYERVRRIVRLRMGRELRRSVDSGDILQETFHVAVRAFDSFQVRDEASLINWLSKLAERQVLTAAAHHRAHKRDKRREVLISEAGSRDASRADSMPMDLAASTTGPLEHMSAAEQTEIVEECIRGLDEEQRELIILRDYAGAAWDSVARETGRPSEAAARMAHSRAVIELAKRIRARGLA
jgi:RNA polymerase sigma-70 factor (subfamily 1)